MLAMLQAWMRAQTRAYEGKKIHFYRAGHKHRDLRSASAVLGALDPGTLVRPKEMAEIETGMIER